MLLSKKVVAAYGEDVFRLHLLPDVGSDLPRITSSVLKTRSTLTVNKVFKYLVKKLNEIQEEDGYKDEACTIQIKCLG